MQDLDNRIFLSKCKKQCRSIIIILFGVCICFLIYHNIIFAKFFSWDDIDLVFNNDTVHKLNPTNLSLLSSSIFLGNYMPLTMLLYAIEWWIGCGSSWPFHLTNVLLHFSCSIIVYRLANSIFNSQSIGIFSSLLFLCAPIQVESVAWISEQKTVLAGLFYLLAMLYYLKYLNDKTNRTYLIVLILFVLGILSKATTVTLPISLLGIALVSLGTRGVVDHWRGLALMVCISFAFGMLAIWAQAHDGYLRPERLGFPIVERMVLAMYALVLYAVNIVAPFHLSALYPYPSSLGWVQYVVGGIGLFLIILALSPQAIRSRNAGWILLFAGPLIPLLQLIPFGEAFMADRYAYVSCFPLFLLIAYGIQYSCNSLRLSEWSLLISYFLIIITYTYISHHRASLWADEIAFFKDVADKYPESDIAQFNMATAYKQNQKFNEARIYYSRAVQLNGKYPQAWFGLGLVNEELNNCNDAINNFSMAINTAPDHPNIFSAYYHRALCYQQLNFSKLSRDDLQESIRNRSDFGPAHYMLAQSFAKSGAWQLAIEEYSNAMLHGYEPEACLLNRAISFGWIGRYDKSIDDLDKVIQIDPANKEGWFLRGIAKHRGGLDGCADLHHAEKLGYEPAIRAIADFCFPQSVVHATPPPAFR